LVFVRFALPVAVAFAVAVAVVVARFTSSSWSEAKDPCIPPLSLPVLF
jgi:hypothetical protein